MAASPTPCSKAVTSVRPSRTRPKLLPPIPEHLKLRLKLKRPAAEMPNAALATVAQPDQSVPRVPMEATVSMVMQAHQAHAAHPLHQHRNCSPRPNSSARAKPHQATLDPADRKDPMDPPAMLVLQALMVNQAAQVTLAQPARQVPLETQAQLALREMLEKSLAPRSAQPVNQAPMANQAQPAQLVNQARPVRMVAPARPAHPETLVPQATQAKVATPVPPATPASLVLLAAANTAHQLARPQAIKRQQHHLRIESFDICSDVDKTNLASTLFMFQNLPSFASDAFSIMTSFSMLAIVKG